MYYLLEVKTEAITQLCIQNPSTSTTSIIPTSDSSHTHRKGGLNIKRLNKSMCRGGDYLKVYEAIIPSINSNINNYKITSSLKET